MSNAEQLRNMLNATPGQLRCELTLEASDDVLDQIDRGEAFVFTRERVESIVEELCELEGMRANNGLPNDG